MAPDKTLQSRLPPLAPSLFDAKKKKGYTFADIASKLGNRDEVWVAALFYGQAKPDKEDIKKLAEVLDVRESYLVEEYGEDFFPDKGKLVDMPPRDPLIYRLYEMVSIYGYAYKAIIHEKFGDGIMSAISFSTKIEKEVDEAGTWVKITQRGKFLPYTKF